MFGTHEKPRKSLKKKWNHFVLLKRVEISKMANITQNFSPGKLRRLLLSYKRITERILLVTYHCFDIADGQQVQTFNNYYKSLPEVSSQFHEKTHLGLHGTVTVAFLLSVGSPKKQINFSWFLYSKFSYNADSCSCVWGFFVVTKWTFLSNYCRIQLILNRVNVRWRWKFSVTCEESCELLGLL